MPLTTTISRNSYTAAGQVSFTYAFKIFAEADLVVYLDGIAQTLTTNYTVTGVGVVTGGEVVFGVAPTVGAVVTIVRSIAATRVVDYATSGSFTANVVNAEFDKLFALDQDYQDGLSRSIRLVDSDPAATMVLPITASRASKYLAFDSSGNLTTVTTSGLSPLGGTAGQFLKKNSSSDYDSSWVNLDSSYLTLATDGTLTNERVLTGTANQITVTDGGAGTTATLSFPTAMTLTGKTLTGGTYSGITLSGTTTLPGSGSIGSTGLLTSGNGITMSSGNFRLGSAANSGYLIHAYSATNAALFRLFYEADSSSGPRQAFHKGRTTGISLAGDDILGTFEFYGLSTTSTQQSGASILVRADGAHTDGASPSYMSFSTTPSASTTALERLRLRADGSIYVAANSKQLVDTSGNIPVARLNSGTSAASSTFWRGDATWSSTLTSGLTVSAGDLTVTAGGIAVGNQGLGGNLLRLYSTTNANSLNCYYQANDASGPKCVFNKYRGSGNEIATGDIIGVIDALAANAAGTVQRTGQIVFEADGASAVGASPGRIRFLTTPAGSTTAAEIMRIDAAGGVGIGKTAASGKKLDVNGAITGTGVQINGVSCLTRQPIILTVSASTATTTITTTGTASEVVNVTCSANSTFTITTSGMTDGQKLQVNFIQDATGSRTVAFDATVAFGTTTASFTATTTAAKTDVCLLVYSSAKTAWLFLQAWKGY